MIMIKALTASMDRIDRIFLSLAFAGSLMFSACSSSDEETTYEIDLTDYASVAVRGFSLQPDSKVLHNLDSVFFSIDLNNAQIFNADSLPYGTDVSSLAVSITTDECKSITIYAPDENGEEKEIDYINNDDAAINFSFGEVKMKVVSSDGEHSRDYSIKVNVHTVVPDSLYWSKMACSALPTTFSNPTEQKTVKMGGKAYCLTTDGVHYSMSTTDNPFGGLDAWQKDVVGGLPEQNVDVRSLTATDDALYVLTASGRLLTSRDGLAWETLPPTWHAIVAGYGSTLLGLVAENGVYKHVTYPASASVEATTDFPVSGYSAAVVFETKWAASNQIVIAGGRKADGSLVGGAWAYDGASWARIGDGLPAAEGYAVTKYVISETDTVSWRLKNNEVLLAFGGRTAAGTAGRDVYLSRDMGMTWKKGDSYLQLPDYMPSVYNADLLSFPVTMTVPAEPEPTPTGWSEMPVKKLPSIYARSRWSRAISATESWECPFLYMFGGVPDDGFLQNAMWRGVINHFTFRPLE